MSNDRSWSGSSSVRPLPDMNNAFARVIVMAWLHVAAFPYVAGGDRHAPTGRDRRRNPPWCMQTFGAEDEEQVIVQVPRGARTSRKTSSAQLSCHTLAILASTSRALRMNNIEMYDVPSDSAPLTTRLVGMVQVKPGMLYEGPLTHMPEGARDLREYMLWACDFYTVNIQNTWVLELVHPETFTATRARRRTSGT